MEDMRDVAIRLGVGILLGVAQEKLSRNLISLIGAAEGMHKTLKEGKCSRSQAIEIALLYEPVIEKAKKELLTQD